VALRPRHYFRRIALFLAMLISGGSLLLPRVPMLVLMLLLAALAGAKVFKLRRRVLPVLAVLASILVLTLLRPAGIQFESLVTRFANFGAGLVLLELYLTFGRVALWDDLRAIVRPMAYQAIATILAGQIANFLFVPFDIAGSPYSYYTFLGVLNYHEFHVEWVPDRIGPVRPDGFFFEPGIFQIYLNLYLYLALFIFRSRSQALLAAAAVLATQSTAGVVACLILIGSFLATEYVTRGSLASRLLKTVGGLIILTPLVVFVASNVTEKFSGQLRGSFWARQYDLETGLNVIAANPLLGIGFDYSDYNVVAGRLGDSNTPLGASLTRDRGNTNGLVFLAYSVGIPLSIPFLIGIFRQRLFPHRLLVGSALALFLMAETMIFQPFFLMIIFSGMCYQSRRREPAGTVAAMERGQRGG
jgi:hypothetical protein